MASGEALAVGTARGFLARHGSHCTLSNVLSTTETSADICMLRHVSAEALDAVAPADAAHVPVLRLLGGEHGQAGSDAGSDGQPLHVWTSGVVWGNRIGLAEDGRLTITGWNVEAGYLAGDDSTSFSETCPRQPPVVHRAPDPPATHRFVSADLGFWASGCLCISGRSDAVVKLRGHRIDLAGVEAALLECEAVSDCGVVTHEDSLIACVVLRRTAPSSSSSSSSPSPSSAASAPAAASLSLPFLSPSQASAELELAAAFCRARFPAGSRPTLLPVEKLPYSATGKRDRAALRAALPELIKPAAPPAEPPAPAPAAPSGALAEADILEYMCRHLGLPLGPHDDFFERGGNSFKALRIAAALGFGVTSLFAHPTAARLAAHLSSAAPTPAVATVPGAAAPPAPRAADPPLPAQERPVHREMRREFRLPAPSAAPSEPVLVVGMAVLMPGADSLAELWETLHRPADTLSELPAHCFRASQLNGDYIGRKGVVRSDGMQLARLGLTAATAQQMSLEQRISAATWNMARGKVGLWRRRALLGRHPAGARARCDRERGLGAA